MKTEFNGYGFEDKKNRKKMKYIVVFRGDLDLNGCYAFTSIHKAKKFFNENYYKEAQAIFEIKDITPSHSLDHGHIR